MVQPTPLGSEDTIVAISTPLGIGGVSLLRLSGPQSLPIIKKLLVTKRGAPFRRLVNRQVHYGLIRDPLTGEHVDEVLATVMRAPASYTAEDVVEIGCHGGMAAAQAVLELVLQQGARLAEPGEFTKRAFLNGRIDLAQSEAVCDLVHSRTQASLRSALQQLQGGVSREINRLLDSLVKATAVFEASLDFPEEDLDMPEMHQVTTGLQEVRAELDRLISSYSHGRILREGVRTILVGKPNVGKSSLFNALLNQERAIVTETPGTTRDSIEEAVNIAGIPFVLVDTAGIRQGTEHIEILSVRRTTLLLEGADLAIFLIDASEPLTDEHRAVLRHLQGKKVLTVLNKSDLPRRVDEAEVRAICPDPPLLNISALFGTGIEHLRDAMRSAVLKGHDLAPESPVITTARHKEALVHAREALDQALTSLAANEGTELTVVDLRESMDALGTITGRSVSTEVLGQIFSRFCIGK